MHIAYFSPSWPPDRSANGAVTYVAAMAEELTRRGHSVSIVTHEGIQRHGSAAFEPAVPSGLRYRAASMWDRLASDTASGGENLRALFQKLHRQHPIDVIEIEESFGWCKAVSKVGVPVVTRLHGPHFRTPQWTDLSQRDRWSRNRERRERRALSRAEALTSPARTTLDETCAHYQCRAGNREVIVNPVKISPAGEAWSDAGSDRNLLLWVGAFTVRKGADILLAAFELIAEQFPDLRLCMVGPDSGFALDGAELRFDEFCERFLKAPVRHRIQMMGRLKPEEIRILRRQAGLTVVSSRSEVFPYIVAEAMAAGSPIVSTRWGGEAEMITHGRTGWIADDNSPEALAAALREALGSSPATREQFARAGWEFCDNHLAQRPVGEKTLAFYRAVIASAASQAA